MRRDKIGLISNQIFTIFEKERLIGEHFYCLKFDLLSFSKNFSSSQLSIHSEIQIFYQFQLILHQFLNGNAISLFAS